MENDSPAYMGANYGKVVYIHGGALDVPLEIVKNSDDTLLPVADYKGAIVTGACPRTTCAATQVIFPQSEAGIFGNVLYNAGLPSWYGTLLDGQTDASGYIYRRNRYLNPTNGRFTQADPLGLAGGLNVYGYANGDPVNYSDPFGLCSAADGYKDCCHESGSPEDAAMLYMSVLFALGDAINGGGGGLTAGEAGALSGKTMGETPATVEGNAPEAEGGGRIYRRANGPESATRLERKATEAEQSSLKIHGVRTRGQARQLPVSRVVHIGPEPAPQAHSPSVLLCGAPHGLYATKLVKREGRNRIQLVARVRSDHMVT